MKTAAAVVEEQLIVLGVRLPMGADARIGMGQRPEDAAARASGGASEGRCADQDQRGEPHRSQR